MSKNKNPVTETSNLYVDVDHNCYDSYHSGEQWGDWHSHSSTKINGVSLCTQKDGWRDRVPIDFDVKIGDTIYLIYCVYSTGDSFGHASGGSYECIIAYKTLAKADAARKALDSSSKNFDDCTVNLVSESGKIVPYYRPWLGYFESLDRLIIESFTVSSEKIKIGG